MTLTRLMVLVCLFPTVAVIVTSVTGATAQTKQPSSPLNNVFKFVGQPQSAYTADLRTSFAAALSEYCQAILTALPTNTPAEDAWVASEQKTADVAKFRRVLESAEYNRSLLKDTFSKCGDTTTFLIQLQNTQGKRTSALTNFEAQQFVALAVTFNVFLEDTSSKVKMTADVKSAFDDLHLHVLRTGLLRAALQALQVEP
jgi:hypothetical protein